MFWLDGALSWVSYLSIRSFLRFPSITLQIYSYDGTADPNLPRCEWKNADEIIPYDVADRYRRKFSIRFATNIFRFQLLYQKGGWYFDTDCVLIKPLDSLFDSQYVFGWEDSGWVGASVMKSQS